MLPQRDALEKRRLKLQSELKRAVDILRDLGAERIVLVGSMAENTCNAYSDIDLIVIIRTEERFLDRLKRAYAAILPSVAMDIFMYTPEEFEEMSESSPFLANALKGGRVLYAA